MSHLGMKILYGLLNERADTWCERVFAPWPDFEELLRREHIPLYALESFSPLSAFDFIGFTLQYELSFTNILNMLELGGIPVKASERSETDPIVIAGGPCACNPEPIADFIDLFVLGEGEEVLGELMDLYLICKENGHSKTEFMKKASQIEGVYVPSLYCVSYQENGTIRSVEPLEGAPQSCISGSSGIWTPPIIPIALSSPISRLFMTALFWRSCAAVFGAAVSVRPAFSIARCGRRVPDCYAVREKICAKTPDMKKSLYPRLAPATIPSLHQCWRKCWILPTATKSI